MSDNTPYPSGLPVPIVSDILPSLSFQSYASGRTINGVWRKSLKKFRSENGWFTELLRAEQGAVENLPEKESFQLRQISLSFAEPGRINAFHIHPRAPQHELWTVLQGQLIVWLVDCREGSPTAGVQQKVILSGEEPVQLYIPAGVAHGYKAGPQGAHLIYVMNQQFNAEHPNEGRLPWDRFGADLWEEDRG